MRPQASPALLVLAALFVTVLVTSNLIAVKLVNFGGGWAATPLTYLVVGWLKRLEHQDHFDRGHRLQPAGAC